MVINSPPRPLVAATSAPTRVIAAMVLTQLGLYVALMTPITVSMTIRVNSLVPADGNRAAALGTILGVGAFFALAANPVFGHLSDRTTSRFGRRRPWLVVGALGGVAGLAIIGTADSVTGLLVGWCVAQMFLNATLAVGVALIADQIPPHQRGKVSGMYGVSMMVGMLLGTLVATQFTGNHLLLLVAPAAVLVVAVAFLVAVLPDRPLDPADRPPFSLKAIGQTFTFNPRQHPDFGWAWASRFLGMYAAATVMSFQALYLATRLDLSDAELPGAVLKFQLVMNVFVILTALVAGYVSDRVGHRKRWVLAASLVQAVGMGVLAYGPATESSILLGAAIAGVALGAFFSVELALAVSVLPDPNTAAKDLGVYNIANAAPQSVAPAVGPALIGAGGFPLLFAAASGAALLGGATIMKIKGNK